MKKKLAFLVSFFLTLMAHGGAVMWILLGISLICLAIILERTLFWICFLMRYSKKTQKALKGVETLEGFRQHQDSLSHAFQIPSLSASSCPSLTSAGQLSTLSHIPSPSVSNHNGHASHASGIPSKS